MFKRITSTLLAMLMLAMMTTTSLAGSGQGVPDDTTTTGETPSVFDEDVTINADLTVNGTVSTDSLAWGARGVLRPNQGASIELGGTGIPYVDFTNDMITDYDMRLILNGDDELEVTGGNLTVAGTVNSNGLKVTGASALNGPTNIISYANTHFDYGPTHNNYLSFGENGATIIRSWNGSGYRNIVTVNDGGLEVAGDITLGATKRLYAPGRMHIHGEEILYLLNKDGVRVSKSWGGNGNLTVEGSGTFGGTVTTGSSREIKNNISQLSAEEAVEALMSLMPVKYNYKTDSDELELGFIAEDVPDLVARNDRKSLSPMDFAALSVTVIQEQEKRIDSQQAQIDQLKALVNELLSNK